MSFASKIHNMLRSFCRNEKGTTAVEFALILPILITLCLGTWEVGTAYMVKRKADRAAVTIADLITQGSSISAGGFAGIQRAVESIMHPYDQMATRLRVMGVSINARGQMTVSWDYSTGADLNTDILPNELRVPNSFYVLSAAEIDYDPLFGREIFGAVTFRDTSIMVPRVTTAIVDN